MMPERELVLHDPNGRLDMFRGLAIVSLLASLAGIGFDGTPRLVACIVVFFAAAIALFADYGDAVKAEEDREEGFMDPEGGAAMSVLRVYDPPECDAVGVPLDWERCRTCDGTGRRLPPGPAVRMVDKGFGLVVTEPIVVPERPCARCDGHGSLKAAALAARWIEAKCCEDCGHPMSEGTWQWRFASDEHRGLVPNDARNLELAATWIRNGEEPRQLRTHYSPCDEGCRHGGPMRLLRDHAEPVPLPDQEPITPEWVSIMGPAEASWRSVDVRTLGWPHDLRPDKLRVLCLRCWAAR